MQDVRDVRIQPDAGRGPARHQPRGPDGTRSRFLHRPAPHSHSLLSGVLFYQVLLNPGPGSGFLTRN
jgi:hypothetical protein